MKKAVFLLFGALVLTKILLSFFIPVPLGFSDSLSYFENAKSIFEAHALTDLQDLLNSNYPPLYPLLLSIAYIFNDMNLAFFIMKIIGAVLSSLIVFPAFLLAKEFFTEKKSILLAAIIALLPPMFSFTFYVLAENLFYPLFLFAVYFIYKAFSEQSITWDIFAGIFVGLTYLTKTIGIVLFPLIILLTVWHLLKDKKWLIIKSKCLLIGAALLTILPLLITKGLTRGFSLIGILGYSHEVARSTSHLNNKIIWTLLYSNYLILAAAILLFIFSIQFIYQYKHLDEKTKLFLEILCLATIAIIFLAANNGSYAVNFRDQRMIGRYVESVLPLFIITGFMSIDRIKKLSKKWTIFTAIFLGGTTYFTLDNTFFPINNTSLTHLGIVSYIVESATIHYTLLISIGIALLTLSLLAIKKYTFKKTVFIAFVYFLTITILNTAVIIYDANERWYPLEEVQLGYWINDNLEPDATFLFDEANIPETIFREGEHKNLEEAKDRPMHLMAYWIRGDWDIGDINTYENYQYIVTTKELNLSLAKRGDTINIYQV